MEEKSDMNGKLVMYVLFHPPFSQSEMQLSRAFLCCTDRPLVSYFFSTCAEHNHQHTHYNVELRQCIFRTDFSTSSDWPSNTYSRTQTPLQGLGTRLSNTVHNRISFYRWFGFTSGRRVRVCIRYSCAANKCYTEFSAERCDFSISCTAAFWSPVWPSVALQEVIDICFLVSVFITWSAKACPECSITLQSLYLISGGVTHSWIFISWLTSKFRSWAPCKLTTSDHNTTIKI